MGAFSFSGARKEAEESGMLGGSFFKLKEGDNRLRLMSECLPHTSTFDGQKNFKWLCYVLDRADGHIKAFMMPHKIYKAIEQLQLNPDYQFAVVPMPYDVTITAKKAGTINVEYALIPARKETPLSPDEEEALGAAKPLSEILKALKDKEAKQPAAKSRETTTAPSGPLPPIEPGSELTDDDIPF